MAVASPQLHVGEEEHELLAGEAGRRNVALLLRAEEPSDARRIASPARQPNRSLISANRSMSMTAIRAAALFRIASPPGRQVGFQGGAIDAARQGVVPLRRLGGAVFLHG